MAKFVFVVGDVRLDSEVPFGPVWREAKELAHEFHSCVYRWSYEDGKDPVFEVYFKGGAFLPPEMGSKDRYMVF